MSDDKVDISLVRDKLIGKTPALISGMMEVKRYWSYRYY